MFMLPQIEKLRCVPTADGYVPDDVYTLADHGPAEGDPEEGLFARLSAPGYLDCTAWGGPFESPAAAAEHLCALYGDDTDDGDAEILARLRRDGWPV